MLNIPPLSQEQFFWFRFKDDIGNKRREGCLIPITETTQPPPRPGYKKKPSYDYHNKKFHEVLKNDAHRLNWCVICPSQANVILIYRSQGIYVRELYCSDCQKNIIKI
jgi:hypothetical protein